MEAGERYGRLTAIKPAGVNRHRAQMFWFACNCGLVAKRMRVEDVKSGRSQSCGCTWTEWRRSPENSARLIELQPKARAVRWPRAA
jgi:hypothetical protein